ncbi:MAG: hypothetical protein ACOYWZ_14725 [Bacillota bacterium]
MDQENLLKEKDRLEKLVLNSDCLFSDSVLKQSQKVDKLIISCISKNHKVNKKAS